MTDEHFEHDPFGPAPRDVVQETDAHVGERLRAADGTDVVLVSHQVTENPDGVPIAVGEQRLSGTLYVPRELWDWEDY